MPELTPAHDVPATIAGRILQTMAGAYGAAELVAVESAHIDGCLLHGRSGVDFAEKLVAEGARVRVPTTLNVGGLDQLHPENFKGDAEQRGLAQRLMDCYVEMGCKPIWTCAPYQTTPRPKLGQQVAWAESNAIVFCNSVLGARTERYGDFIDICAAVVGKAPYVGLHTDEGRCAQIVVDARRVPERLLADDVFYPVLGYWLGMHCGRRVPAIVGLPGDASEDQLKALGAAAASSGALAMFHAVGVTPEAPSLGEATGGGDVEQVTLQRDSLLGALERLSTVHGEGDVAVDVVALGSPHFSVVECERLVALLDGHPKAPDVELVVCTHRAVLAALDSRGLSQKLRDAGVRIVVDTCVVVAPILEHSAGGTLMTNSGKFAHYAPGNIGFGVVYGSLEDCVLSAEAGRVVRSGSLWEPAW